MTLLGLGYRYIGKQGLQYCQVLWFSAKYVSSKLDYIFASCGVTSHKHLNSQDPCEVQHKTLVIDFDCNIVQALN